MEGDIMEIKYIEEEDRLYIDLNNSIILNKNDVGLNLQGLDKMEAITDTRITLKNTFIISCKKSSFKEKVKQTIKLLKFVWIK